MKADIRLISHRGLQTGGAAPPWLPWLTVWLCCQASGSVGHSTIVLNLSLQQMCTVHRCPVITTGKLRTTHICFRLRANMLVLAMTVQRSGGERGSRMHARHSKPPVSRQHTMCQICHCKVLNLGLSHKAGLGWFLKQLDLEGKRSLIRMHTFCQLGEARKHHQLSTAWIYG